MYINNLHFSDRYLHLNDRNIFKIISKDFYYPKLFLYIRDIVGKCHICMLASKPILRKTPYKSFDYPSKPRVSWSFDLAGSIGSKLLFIAVCDFSLYAVIKAYDSKIPENFIDFLENSIFVPFGIPCIIRSDNEPSMKSKKVTDFLKKTI